MQQIEAAADAATWSAVCAALEAYREAIAALQDVGRRHPLRGPEFAAALRTVRAAHLNIHTCWLLHFGAPPPA